MRCVHLLGTTLFVLAVHSPMALAAPPASAPAAAAQAAPAPAAGEGAQAAPAAPVKRAVNQTLAADPVLPEPRVENVKLKDALEYIADLSKANVFVDWNALADAGVRPAQRASLK